MEISDDYNFASKLRALRALRGWSQDCCAFQIGVSVQAWRNWEQNKATPHKFLKEKVVQIFPELEQ